VHMTKSCSPPPARETQPRSWQIANGIQRSITTQSIPTARARQALCRPFSCVAIGREINSRRASIRCAVTRSASPWRTVYCKAGTRSSQSSRLSRQRNERCLGNARLMRDTVLHEDEVNEVNDRCVGCGFSSDWHCTPAYVAQYERPRDIAQAVLRIVESRFLLRESMFLEP
jgi:hypothetical protein